MPQKGGAIPHRDRRRARAWIVQILYRWESEGPRRTPLEVMEETFRNRRVAPERKPYVRRVLEALSRDLDRVDRLLEASLENWRLERLSRIDRCIIRLAAAEILHLDDVPPRVSIQEALALADRYGTDESPGFVNGVLDALFKSVESGR